MEGIMVNKKVFSVAVNQLHKSLHDVIEKELREDDFNNFINQVANFLYIINDSSPSVKKALSH